MKKYKGTLYKSRWDKSTWFIIGLVTACCLVPIVLDDDGIIPVIISAVMLAFVIIVFSSVYYRIDGNNLVVYQFFIPAAYPIDMITEIKATKSYLSAPATSLTHRIAIRFSDRRVLKSSMPLIISPASLTQFVEQLLSINPDINVRFTD